MNTEINVAKSSVEKIWDLNLFQHLFAWKSIRNNLINSASALSKPDTEVKLLQQNNTRLNYQSGIALGDELDRVRLYRNKKKRLAPL